MMNVLNVTENLASPCTGEGQCICKFCTRKKKLQMLGFSEKSVSEYLSEEESGKSK